MHPDATRSAQGSTAPRDRAHAVRCLELGGRSWKLAATTGPGQAARLRTVPARALDRTLSELARAQTRFHVAAETRVVSCYEAGRDGSWLHHALKAHGVRNHVVDSRSIEVNRRQRRTKARSARCAPGGGADHAADRARAGAHPIAQTGRLAPDWDRRARAELLVALEVYLRTGTVPKGADVPLRDRCHR